MRHLFRQPRPATGPRNPTHPGWMEYTTPLIVGEHTVQLRPLMKSDGEPWSALRLADADILARVEPTIHTSWTEAHSSARWREFYNSVRHAADDGVLIPFAIDVDGKFCGQVTLGSIQRGSASDCWVGYWVSSHLTGLGIATAACALGVDHAFDRVGVHRVTATYLPENLASRRVLEKTGFREEGYLHKNLHIFGQWRDHYLMAITIDDYADSCVTRLIKTNQARYA